MEASIKLRNSVVNKTRKMTTSGWHNVLKVGKDDPRRIIHALKVGIALAMVSFLYVLEPLFKGVGENAMWAVITVVVVFEFTAGATLCKGLNRGFGTLSAGSLAFLVEFIVDKSTPLFHGVFTGVAVFSVGFAATYIRFIPHIKRNYDYGVLIFLLTFNLITVSSFCINDILKVARDRLYTIAIGCAICLFMSLFVLPNWSGEDLHNSIVKKIDGLSKSIEASVNTYFQDLDTEIVQEKLENDSIFMGYKMVLDSKSAEETLAQFASWEPMHSRHCYRYPWQQYAKVGAALRNFGYVAVSLHGCLEAEIQAPWSLRLMFKEPCIRVGQEISKVLFELARSIKRQRHCSFDNLSEPLHKALLDLNSAIQSQPRLFVGVRSHRPSPSSTSTAFFGETPEESPVTLRTAKTDNWDVMGSNSHKGPRGQAEQRMLRPSMSKLVINSLEFSEALPFAAFASLLVETAARLDAIIEEVEQLAWAANFREAKDDLEVKVEENSQRSSMSPRHLLTPGSLSAE